MVDAVVGAVSGILVAGIGAWGLLRARAAPEARVEVVDVAFLTREDFAEFSAEEREAWGWREDADHIPAVLDIKLRNSGGQVAYVHGLTLDVTRRLSVPPTPLPRPAVEGFVPRSADDRPTYARAAVVAGTTFTPRGPFPPSTVYRMTSGEILRVDAGRPGTNGVKRLSQVLGPGAVDRFCVAIHQDDEPYGPLGFLRLRAEISYNAVRSAKFGREVASPLFRRPEWERVAVVRERLLRDTAYLVERLPSPEQDEFRLPAWRNTVGRYLDAYERHLDAGVAFYAQAGQDADPEVARMNESLAELPALRLELEIPRQLTRPSPWATRSGEDTPA
ncbi:MULTISPECIES: hypothetical protein [unclassified Streptomyces]|uniref:hypothetical protein n=1 Tax=unclassified Streptomyces TaxID=2593676 RepID=UPI0037F68BF1